MGKKKNQDSQGKVDVGMHVCNLSVKEAEARNLEFKAGVWGMREE